MNGFDRPQQDESVKHIQLVTDGSCLSNPDGPGGWACLVRYRGNEEMLQGFELETTNNRMELMAAISGLSHLRSGRHFVQVTTDSEYVKKGITEWVPRWKRRNWTTGEGKPVKNKDLWLQLDALVKLHDVQWTWTRGHSGHAENERVDKIARQMAEYARDTRN